MSHICNFLGFLKNNPILSLQKANKLRPIYNLPSLNNIQNAFNTSNYFRWLTPYFIITRDKNKKTDSLNMSLFSTEVQFLHTQFFYCYLLFIKVINLIACILSIYLFFQSCKYIHGYLQHRFCRVYGQQIH